MEKLDANFLNIVRNKIHKKVSKKREPSPSTSAESTTLKAKKKKSGKNKVSTPSNPVIVSINDEKISPSLTGTEVVSQGKLNFNNGKKRRRSVSSEPVVVKKKKEKHFGQKGVKLDFDEQGADDGVQEKKKIRKKKKDPDYGVEPPSKLDKDITIPSKKTEDKSQKLKTKKNKVSNGDIDSHSKPNQKPLKKSPIHHQLDDISPIIKKQKDKKHKKHPQWLINPATQPIKAESSKPKQKDKKHKKNLARLIDDEVDLTGPTVESSKSKPKEKKFASIRSTDQPKQRTAESSKPKQEDKKHKKNLARLIEDEVDLTGSTVESSKPKPKEKKFASIPDQPKQRTAESSKPKQEDKKPKNIIPQWVLDDEKISSILESTEDANSREAFDFYDDDGVNVKGMKFDRFCAGFHQMHDVNGFIDTTPMRISLKYFKDDAGEDIFETDTAVDEPAETDDQPANGPEEESPVEVEEIRVPPKVITLKDFNKVVILANVDQTIYFTGLCTVKVLHGKVDVLGTILDNKSPEKNVYSPRGSSLIYINNICKLVTDSEVKLADLISKDLLHQQDLNKTFNRHAAIIVCSSLKQPHIDFIEEHTPHHIFPETISQCRLDFALGGSFNKIRVCELWEDVFENVAASARVVLTGGKGVGKSTLLRYGINVLLRKHRKVCVMELDPGQSEFHPPGCVSVCVVEEPVLGPNYTHLKTAERMILTHINISHNIQHYLKSIKHLVDSENSENIPTLINFPGYTQEIGLDVAVQSLKLLNPTNVIEIKSKTQSRNYKMDINPENVNSFSTIHLGLDGERRVSYEYVKLDSLAEKNTAWSLEARQAREMCILSYFGQMMHDGVKDLTNCSLDMYCKQLSQLTLCTHKGTVVSPLAVNGALVALCSLAYGDADLFISYGYGFVRGLDPETDIIVLLTPEPIEALEKVTHLVLTSVTTLPSLILSASDVKGQVPYVNVGELNNFGQFTKRSYVPAAKSKN